jgi:hypothetical protein
VLWLGWVNGVNRSSEGRGKDGERGGGDVREIVADPRELAIPQPSAS